MDGKVEEGGSRCDVNKLKRIEGSFAAFQVTPGLTKLICAVAAGSFLGFGIRSAKKYFAYLQPGEYNQLHYNTGFNFASRALVISTVITVSGYALFVIGVSALLNVNNPRQFGDKMQHLFGNKFRLEKKRSLEKISEVLRYCQRGLPKCKRALVIFAHPDDETMFFSPTLHGLFECGTTLYFLCISSGNQNGLGKLRKAELAMAIRAHGFSVDNLTILEYDLFNDGFVVWSRQELAKAALKFIEVLEVDTVITFDEDGVSLHPNHASCFRALQYLYSVNLLPPNVQVFVLESVPMWRKYFLLVDAVISSFHSTFLYVSSPWAYLTTWRAMFAHASQMLWFRYLYMMFSRYILINTLKRIHMQKYCFGRNPHPKTSYTACLYD